MGLSPLQSGLLHHRLFFEKDLFPRQVHNTIKSLSIVVSRLGEEKIKVHRTPKLIDGGFGLSEQAPCFLKLRSSLKRQSLRCFYLCK